MNALDPIFAHDPIEAGDQKNFLTFDFSGHAAPHVEPDLLREVGHEFFVSGFMAVLRIWNLKDMGGWRSGPNLGQGEAIVGKGGE